MSSLIAITFINKEIKANCPKEDLLQQLNKSKTKFCFRPKNFKELENEINDTFQPKKKIKHVLSYNVLYSTGKIVEIVDDLILSKDFPFIIVYYKKKSNKIIIPDSDIDELIKREDSQVELKLSENIDLENTFNINQFIKMKETFSSEIKNSQDTLFERCIENINTSLDEELRNSAIELFNSSKKKIIEQTENLRKSFVLSSKNLLQKNDEALLSLKKNTKDIKKISEEIKKYNSNKQVNQKIRKEKPKPEPEEKIIFRFNKGVINLEQEISKKDTKKKIKINNINIKNISKKEYNSELMAWIKEDNSNKQINFEQEGINSIFPFQNKKIYKSQEDVNDLYLNLIVDNPQDETDYKMIVSIINKEKKNVISEKPLEIVVTMKKVLIEEEINEILNNLKKQIEYFELFIKDDEVIKIIKDKKGDENIIKEIVEKNFENKKKNKINELINRLDNETNFHEFLTNEEVEEKILSFKLDENETKNWIISKRPAPNPIPGPDDNNDEERINEIIDDLDNELYVRGYIDEEELKKIILDSNFDIKKIKEAVSKRM